jgi:hypothetical protein
MMILYTENTTFGTEVFGASTTEFTQQPSFQALTGIADFSDIAAQ